MMKKNILYYLATIFFRFLGRFVLIFILARLLNLNDFGLFTYALTFGGIITLVLDAGYNIKLLKDIPANIEKLPELLGNALFLKFIFLVIFFLAIFSNNFFTFFNITDNEVMVVRIFIISGMVISFINFFLLPYKATDRYLIETMIIGIDSISTLIFVSVMVYYFGFLAAAYTYLFIKIIILLITTFLFFSNFSISFSNLKFIAELQKVLSYAIYEIIGGIYLSIDTLILKQYVENNEIALYQVGLRLLFGSQILLSIVNSVFLPRLSKISNNEQIFFQEARKINIFMLSIGLFLFLILLFFIDNIIIGLFGENFLSFQQISLYFILIIFLRYISSIYSILLIIVNKQKIRTYAMIFSFFCLILSDYYMIPRHGIEGAAIVLLAVHVFLALFFISFSYIEHKSFFVLGKA